MRPETPVGLIDAPAEQRCATRGGVVSVTFSQRLASSKMHWISS
jgi:hypothetical protein